MRTRPRWILALTSIVLAFAAAFGGCGGCKAGELGAPPPSAAAFLPAKPRTVVLVPAPGRLGEVAKELEQTKLAGLAASALGAPDAGQLLRPLVAQLGFDPRSAEGFAQAGIDGGRSLAFGQDGAGGEVLVIPISDQAAFGAYVEALARRQGGGTMAVTSHTPEGAPQPEKRDIHTFADGAGRIRVAYGIRDGFAVIGSGQGAVEVVGRSLALARAQSLEQAPAFQRIRGKLGDRHLYAWTPGGGEGATGRGLQEGMALGIRASVEGVNARVLIPRGPLEVAMIRPLGKVAGMELMEQLTADHFLAIRLGGEPVSLQPLLGELLPRGVAAGLRRAEIHPVSDILKQLQPGAVIGLSLNPDLDLSRGLPTQLSIGRTNPFAFVHTTLVARVKDPARASEVLARLAANATHFQMEIASEEVEGVRVYQARYSGGEGMRWALIGDTLLAAGGKGAFERARARLEAGSGKGGAPAASEPGPAAGGVAAGSRALGQGAEGSGDATPLVASFRIEQPGARALFESAGSAAHLDVPRLAAALRAVPPSAFGVGGFRLKELLDTWVELFDEVEGITASLSIDELGLVVDADLGLR